MIPLPKVAVAILNYNTRNYLEKFLPSVMASTYANTHVVVIDNASNDGSADFIQQHYPGVQLVVLPRNYGFAGGYNEGLKHVNADYFVLLNSDVEVTPGWIDPVIAQMEADATIAAVQPKILSYKEGHLFEYAGAAGGYIDALGYPFCRGRVFDECEKDTGQYNTIEEIFWATGAAMFIRATAWQEVEGLDADFFAHMEEIDMCWRLKNRGYRILVNPASRVYHVGGGTLTRENPRKTQLNFRNALIFLVKNLPLGQLWWKLPVRMVLDGVAGLHYFIKGQWSNTFAILKAHVYFYRGMRTWFGKRKSAMPGARPGLTGIFPGSIVFAHYVLRKKKFSDLQWKQH